MLGWDGELPPPSVRTTADMRGVLANPSCDGNDSLYFMYRDLAKTDADRQWLHARDLRYDLTVIPPRDLSGEWVKTKGHYHPKNGAGTGYPEIYEVLSGRAHYLLQSQALDDIVMVDAGAGDLVIMPPGYGHITINPSPDETLVMANIVSTAFESEYAEYERLHGAAYYEMKDGTLRKNSYYPPVPPVRHVSQKNGDGSCGALWGPLYSLIGNDTALAFLNHPERCRTVFTGLLRD